MEFIIDETRKFRIEIPAETLDGWTVVKQKSVIFNKGDIVLEKFKEDFPEIKVTDYDQITKLASRSKKLASWLSAANVLYSDTTQLPVFLQDRVKPEEYVKIQQKLNKIKDTVTLYAKKRQELSDSYDAEIKKFEELEKRDIEKITGGDKIITVLNLTSQYLPLSLQLLIENYSATGVEDLEESRKVYGRELLIRYKTALIDIILKEPSIDIEKIIKQNELK